MTQIFYKLALKLSIFALFTTSLDTGVVYAQDAVVNDTRADALDFSLFESVESSDQAAQPRGRTSRQSRSNAAEPEFTLAGTSRIGSRYSAILVNKDGNEVRVSASPGTNTAIAGYGQFSVVDINAGRVAIQYPGNTPCVEYEDKGVSCNSAANIAALELTTGSPIQSSAGQSRAAEPEPEGEVVVSEEIEEPTNPFAALRERAQANGIANPAAPPGNSQRRSFTPRRIDAADVPPGMRVVSTPFGDRLVEE